MSSQHTGLKRKREVQDLHLQRDELERELQPYNLFEKLSEDLRKHDVIEIAGDMLHRVIQLCNRGRKDKPLITGTVNAKIYLAAYMIAAKPKRVFDDITELEKKVMDASRPLVDAFHATAEELMKGTKWKQIAVTKDLPTLLCTYLRTFKEWKIVDERKLAGRLKKALKGIEDAIVKAKAEESPAARSMVPDLEEQQQKLKAKLRQIGADADDQAGGKTEEAPMPVTRGLGGKSAVTAARVVKTHSHPETAGQTSGSGMTNEQLAHELLIDSEFRLDDKAGASDEKLVHTKIRETFEKAFWDSLVEDLTCEPPSFSPVLNVLAEIRTGIEGLSQHQPESHQIRDIIDIDHIKSQLKENSLDFKGCERLIDNIMSVVMSMHLRMKAVERRDETLSLWKACQAEMQLANDKANSDRARAICKALELVLDRVHKIRVDTANNKLRAIAPVIRRHGIEYEKSHFAKKLQLGAITMDRSRQWLKHTVDQLRLQQNKDPALDIKALTSSTPDLTNLPAKYEAIILSGLVDLVTDYPNWGGETRPKEREDELPETMMLDLLRVKALHVHFHTDVVSAIIMTQIDQESRNRVRDAATRAKILMNTTEILKQNPPKPSKLQAVIKLVMDEISPYLSESDKNITLTLIEKHVARTHAVYMHMSKQFKLYWFHKLSEFGSTNSQTSTNSQAAPYQLKVSDSVKWLEAETFKHAQFLSIVSVLNLKVHTNRYNDILNNLLFPNMPAKTDPEDDDTSKGGEIEKKMRRMDMVTGKTMGTAGGSASPQFMDVDKPAKEAGKDPMLDSGAMIDDGGGASGRS